MVRAAARRWVHLPHDVPQALFHAHAGEGGFGLPELVVQVPLMRRARIGKLFDRARREKDPVLAAVADMSKELRRERERWREGMAFTLESAGMCRDLTDYNRLMRLGFFFSIQHCCKLFNSTSSFLICVYIAISTFVYTPNGRQNGSPGRQAQDRLRLRWRPIITNCSSYFHRGK